MHRTGSVDDAVIFSGEIYMLLDKDEAYLSAGDVVAQRGTNHVWSNRWTEPFMIAL